MFLVTLNLIYLEVLGKISRAILYILIAWEYFCWSLYLIPNNKNMMHTENYNTWFRLKNTLRINNLFIQCKVFLFEFYAVFEGLNL